MPLSALVIRFFNEGGINPFAPIFRRDDRNIAFAVSATQLPAMQGVAVADLFMSRGHIREPHWHPNAPQLLTYRVTAGQSVFIPMGWWHWITALSDETHDHVIFTNENPTTVEGSDMLRLTPPEVFQLAYGVDADELASVLAPITETVVIGPVEMDERSKRHNREDRQRTPRNPIDQPSGIKP